VLLLLLLLLVVVVVVAVDEGTGTFTCTDVLIGRVASISRSARGIVLSGSFESERLAM
jgi:hypothetical protein